MAKQRPEPADDSPPKKKEKKVSEDKVQKRERRAAKKEKKAAKEKKKAALKAIKTVGHDLSVRLKAEEESVAQADKEIDVINSGVEVTEKDLAAIEAKKARKAARKAAKAAEKEMLTAGRQAEASAKASVRLTTTDSEPSDKTSVNTTTNGSASNGAATESSDARPLFVIDVNPSTDHLAHFRIVEEVEPVLIEDDSKMNRAARRRLKLIARQKSVIQKKHGIEPGSTVRNADVDMELAAWIEKSDAAAERRAAKKKIMKEKEASRLRNRKGKLLKGIKLKEREKEIRKQERKEAKAAKQAKISAGGH